MRGPCRNCDRWPTSEYRDELGDYYCDECYAYALYEVERGIPPVAGGSGESDGEASAVTPTERKLARRKPQSSPLAEVQFGYTRDQVELIKRTVAKGASDDELQLFLIHSQRTGLDPFSRQIHFIKRWDSREQKEVGAIQTAIDGMRLIASRTNRYRPDDDTPRYTYKGDGSLDTAEVRVYAFHQESKIWFPAPAEARFDEYAQRTRDGKLFPNWQRMPHLMLAKCAEALALRKAFPAELSGIYSEEEVDVIVDGTVAAPRELPRSEKQSEVPAPPPSAPPVPGLEPPRAAAAPNGPASTKDQHTAIHRLAKGKHKLTDEQLDAWLKSTFGVTSTMLLTFQQASEAIGYLQGTPTEAILRVIPASTAQQTSLVG